MKKVFITMIAFLAMSSMALANGHVDSVRYLTTKAWKNWYISASATGNWWQGSMRTPDGFTKSYTAVEWGKPTFGFNAFVGKWINHKIGVRLGYSNTKINSYIHNGSLAMTLNALRPWTGWKSIRHPCAITDCRPISCSAPSISSKVIIIRKEFGPLSFM